MLTKKNEDEEIKPKNKILKSIPVQVEPKEELAPKVREEKAEQEKLKGNEAFNAKSYDEAVIYYTRSIQYIENAAAYNNRALANMKLEKWDKVIEDCNNVFRYEKDNIKAFMRRANAYYKKRKLVEAKKDVDIVLAKEPANKNAKELADNLNLAMKKESAEKEEVQAKGGKRLTIEETDGDSEDDEEAQEVPVMKASLQQAKAEVSKEIEKEPVVVKEDKKPKRIIIEESDDEVEKKAESKVVEETIKNDENKQFVDQHQDIVKDAEKIEERELPAAVVDYKDKANKLFANGQYGEAIGLYTKAIAHLKSEGEENLQYYANNLSVLYSNRASSKQKIGDYKEAICDCDASLALRDGNIKVLFKKASSLESLEKYNEALMDYQKIMKLDSSFKQAQDAYNRVKNSLIQRGAYKSGTENKPKEKQEKIVEEKKDSFDELKLKGNEFFKANDYVKAIEIYTACVKLDSSNVTGYLNRSICYIKTNEAKKALGDCNFVLEHEKMNVKALYRRSLAFKLLKNFEKCVDDLTEVLKLEPKNAIAVKDLSEVKKEIEREREHKAKSVKIEEVKTCEAPKITKKPIETKIEEKKVEEDKKKKQPSQTVLPKDIKNNYEFLQAWNSISPTDYQTYCLLIEKIEPKTLPKFIGSKLDDEMFSRLIKTFHKYLFDDQFYDQDMYDDEYDISLVQKRTLEKFDIFLFIKELIKTPRFDVIKMFLSVELKKLLKEAFECIAKEHDSRIGEGETPKVTKAEIESVKKAYGI